MHDERRRLRREGRQPKLTEIGDDVVVERRDMRGELVEVNLRLPDEEPAHHGDARRAADAAH